jgi:thioredoxin:protein disulfide reductase
MKIIGTVIAAFLLLFANAAAQDSASVVTIRTIAPVEPLKAGKPAVITVELSIASPYHINSNQPLEDYLKATALQLELDPLPGVTFGKTTFPPPAMKTFSFSESPMSVFDGTIKILAEVVPDAGMKQKEIELSGKVRVQACNATTCLRPARKPFSLRLSVENSAPPTDSVRGSAEPAAAAAPEPQTLSPAIAPKPAGKSAPSGATDFGSKGILVTLLLVFLGGLALNLTPCVYPMIPITISYFGGQSQGKKGSLIAHSILYVIGMAITYSVLGVAASMTGGLFGAALRYPPVLIGIALVMVLLALSMFDVYEFRMPAFLNRLAAGSQKGFVGTLFMGLTVGIVAAPCIGPFVLGLLTYVGNKGNAALGFLLFFVLALGMGVPFMVLGVFSGSIRNLPRSGAWMVWVRKVFGFILLAMAVYFLDPLFPNPLVYRLTFALILLLAGIYLAWIDSVQSAGKAFSFIRNIVGVVFFASALYAAITGIETYIKKAQAENAGPSTGSAVQWLPYSQAALDRASREGKPVFIDFYADWCAPCKELDEKTFSTPEVIQQSRSYIMLKADLTSADDPQTEALRKKFEIKGVPTLVFLKPDRGEIPELRGTGFETKEVFLDKMNRALLLSANRPQDSL